MRGLRAAYRQRKDEIKQRLGDFSKVDDQARFYEMCFCICTSQSSAKKCDAAVKRLEKKNFRDRNFNPKPHLNGVRFHNNKSNYLLEAKQKYPDVQKATELSPEEAREWLVKNIKGYGYKESSHFLRNIGKRNLAILDRHILKHLQRNGAIDEVPKSLTPKRYKEIEQSFKDFSKKARIPMDELDLLFWSMETGEVFK